MKSRKLILLAAAVLLAAMHSISALAADKDAVRVSLGKLSPIESQQDSGSLSVDRSVGGKTLQIGARQFQHGLGTHANSRVVYELDGGYERFDAWVGVDSELAAQGYKAGSVVFRVNADGRTLFDSGVMRMETPAKRVSAPLSGVSELELIVADGGDGIYCDHADWADAMLVGRSEPAPAPPPGKKQFEVRSPGLVVELSGDGQIVGVGLGGKHLHRNLLGGTALVGCRAKAVSAGKKLPGGGVEFTRSLIWPGKDKACALMERFLPTPTSVRWEIEIRGSGEPWSTGISTRLHYPAAKNVLFWTSWSDPEHRNDGWRDPLALRPMANTTWTYGNQTNGVPVEGDYISIPIATVAEPAADEALSLVLSPEDALLGMRLLTGDDGGIVFHRTRHRIAAGKVVRFAMDLVAHPADWRGGLGWMVRRYPEYFNPPNPKADGMAGCAAYSADLRRVDAARLKRMAFRVNWMCSEDFPYMGMFLPPLEDADARWERAADEPPIPGKTSWNSFRTLNDYSRWMRARGFYVLNYFNATEFGRRMQFPAPPRKAVADADLWKDANDYFYARLPDAMLRHGSGPIVTCYGALVVDPGDPAYEKFMLAQARRHIEKLPDSAGICIDRMDWLRCYNSRADDGVSWIDGKPARSLYLSWRELMSKLGPLMHAADKVIFTNNLEKRLELLRQVDGIYCEYCQTGPALNSTALLSVRKPALGWTPAADTLRPDPDAFFQRHLYLGVYPTAPYPGNNHCIKPDPWADKYYCDYGPLLDAIRGKKWVLAPHAVSAAGDAKVNLFEVPGGYVVPVTFAGKAASVQVTLAGLGGIFAQTVCEVLRPGDKTWTAIRPAIAGASVRLDVPIARGCAMVRLRQP